MSTAEHLHDRHEAEKFTIALASGFRQGFNRGASGSPTLLVEVAGELRALSADEFDVRYRHAVRDFCAGADTRSDEIEHAFAFHGAFRLLDKITDEKDAIALLFDLGVHEGRRTARGRPCA